MSEPKLDLSALRAPTVEEMLELRAEVRRAQHAEHKARQRQERLVEATHAGAKAAMLAMGPVEPVVAPRLRKKGKKPEVALLHLTDFQGHKVTSSYDSKVMRRRALDVVRSAVHLTEIQRHDHPVNDLAILFGGDMVEGLFNYPAQLAELDDPDLHNQWINVSRLLVDVVRLALANFERVTVVSEWGNHGRIGSIRSEVPKRSNIDRFCYSFARELLFESGEKRLTWDDCPDDIQRVEIGNYRALLAHGDEVGRNGFASPMTLVRACDRWRSGAFRIDGQPWAFRDVYIGHFHTHNEWALANGEGTLYQTGSIESDNRYARDMMASAAIPTQRLHFIEPVKGRVTSQHKVWADG
jgi:hypothetical protein